MEASNWHGWFLSWGRVIFVGAIAGIGADTVDAGINAGNGAGAGIVARAGTGIEVATWVRSLCASMHDSYRLNTS